MKRLANMLRMTEPNSDGRHPGFSHLIFIEAEPHYGSYIVTTPAAAGDMLVSAEDLQHMLGDQWDEDSADQFGYAVDDYIDHFEEDQDEDQVHG